MISTSFLEGFFKHIERVEINQIKSVFSSLKRDYTSFFYILDSLKEHVLILDPHFVPYYCNKQIRDFFLIKEENYATSIFEMLKHEILFQKIKEFTKRNSLHIREQVIIEGFFPKTWDVQVFNFILDQAFIEKKHSIAYLIILEDVSIEKKKLEQTQIKKNILSMEHLAAGLAHEIKNPLTSIHLYLNLLHRYMGHLEENELKKEIQHCFHTIKEELLRLNTMTTDFLTTIRPLSLNLEKVDLKELVRQSTEILFIEMREKKIDITIKEQENLPFIIGDKRYLQIIFFNLIKNAIQSFDAFKTKEKKEIIIEMQENSPFVMVSIKDTGKGIEAQNIEKIFEPYFTTKKEGSGVGLALVHKIITEHKGDIQIKSIKNKGTFCRVLLPMYDSSIRKFLEKPSKP